MNEPLFEQLLYEEESSTLDFKREQYPFAKATDEEKSELLKDILGFANAFRRATAYILIGVEDVRGGRGNVVGIPADAHLADHSLQQFVNSLTNHPVRFHYEAFGFQGKQVGVICIEDQVRPVFLKRDFGKLKKDEVYVRRGSSTDPTKPAKPDEIARMGASARQPAELVVEFGDPQRDRSLGTGISWTAERCEMPPEKSIPRWRPDRRRDSPYAILPSFELAGGPNSGYFRDLARYEFARRLFRGVRLVVKNAGEGPASNVRTEITVPNEAGIIVAYPSDLPDVPRRVTGPYDASRYMRPAVRPPGDVTIERNAERVRVEIEYGNLQPGRQVRSDQFFVGIAQSGDFALTGQVFADNLPRPKDFTLTIVTTVSETRMTVEELMALPDPEGTED